MSTNSSDAKDAATGLTTGADRVRQILARSPHTVLAVSAVGLALSLWLFLTVHPPALVDYEVYRWAVHTWLDGGDVNRATTTSAGIALPWVYPPFALLPLSLVSLVPFAVGVVLLYVFDLLALAVTLHLVIRHPWPGLTTREAVTFAVGLLPFTLFLEPVHTSFGLGQINILLMALVAADCLTEHPRWPRGLLIGLAVAVKLTPAAFLLFFLLRKDFRAAATLTVTAAVATAVGFGINFSGSVAYWFTIGPGNSVSGSEYRGNQSVLAGLARLDMSPWVTTLLWVLIGAALLGAVVVVARRADAVLAVVTTALWALLVSPTSWSDHWVWMLPALLLTVGCATRLRSAGWWTIATVTAAVTVVAPSAMLPGGDEQEVAWTTWQHLVGNSYSILAVVLLVSFVVHALRGPARQGCSGAPVTTCAAASKASASSRRTWPPLAR